MLLRVCRCIIRNESEAAASAPDRRLPCMKKETVKEKVICGTVMLPLEGK